MSKRPIEWGRKYESLLLSNSAFHLLSTGYVGSSLALTPVLERPILFGEIFNLERQRVAGNQPEKSETKCPIQRGNRAGFRHMAAGP